MNIFDQAAREAIRLDPTGQIAWLAAGSASWAFTGWLPTHTTDEPGGSDLHNDLVAELTHRQGREPPWALLIEVQSSPDPNMLARLAEYVGRQDQSLRHGPHGRDRYQVGAVLLNLTGRGQPLATQRHLTGTAITFALSAAGHNVADLGAADTLAAIAAGTTARSVLVWVPLMAGGSEEAVLEGWKRLAEGESDSRRRASFVTLVLIMAELADTLPPWKKALEGFNVTESTYVNSWIEVGETRGALRAARRDLITVLRSRFKEQVPGELVQRVEVEEDAERLSRLLVLAATSNTLGDFTTAMSHL